MTQQGREIQSLYNFFMIAAAVVFLLVSGLITWSVIRHRRKNDELPKQTHGSTKLEVAWTILPTLLVLVLFAATMQTQNRVQALAENPDVRIDVLGFQWQWRFTYLDDSGEPDTQVLGTPEEIPELVLPVDQTVRITLESADVTHAFYVPEALYKRHAIPGRVNEFDMTFEQTGRFPGNCTQYCGLNHAHMVFNVRVVEQAEYEQWLAEQNARPAPEVAAETAPADGQDAGRQTAPQRTE